MTEQQFNEITAWQKQTFPGATSVSKLIHLAGEDATGEIDELKQEIKFGVSYYKMKMEFADCFFLLFGAAAAEGMTYTQIVQAIQEKFEVNKKRNWGKPDANGVVNHVE